MPTGSPRGENYVNWRGRSSLSRNALRPSIGDRERGRRGGRRAGTRGMREGNGGLVARVYELGVSGMNP